MWDRVAFKTAAKAKFKARYWPYVGVTLILTILAGVSTSNARPDRSDVTDAIRNGDLTYLAPEGLMQVLHGSVVLVGVIVALALSLAIALLVRNPYEVGAMRFYLENEENRYVPFSRVGFGFSFNFGNVVVTQFLRGLFIFLWSLLLVIPGIVRAYGYFAVPYILAENPHIDRNRALKLSLEMTNGYKWELFVLDLSFILWMLLSNITAGLVGVFYVNPYIQGTKAEAYRFIRENALRSGIANRSELPGWDRDPQQPPLY